MGYVEIDTVVNGESKLRSQGELLGGTGLGALVGQSDERRAMN